MAPNIEEVSEDGRCLLETSEGEGVSLPYIAKRQDYRWH
jgi:hypothetical protein